MPANPRSLRLSEVYQAEIERISLRTAEASARLVVLTGDLVEAWHNVITNVARLITSGQTRAVERAVGYVRSLCLLETGLLDSVDPREGNIGYKADGGRLSEVLSSQRGTFFFQLADIDKAEATGRAKDSVRDLATYEVADAAGRELVHQSRELGTIKGWRSRSIGGCGACLGRDDGRIQTGGFGPPYHPNCSCIPEPVFDVRETVKRPTGQDRFEGFSETQQDAALGFEKAELIRRGLVDWSRLSTQQDLGESSIFTETPLGDLLMDAGITKEALRT